MNSMKLLIALGTGLWLFAGVAAGAEQPKKLTCCQQAFAKNKECSHRCCIAAHKQKLSCVKCNPNKEDLKLKKKAGVGESVQAKK